MAYGVEVMLGWDKSYFEEIQKQLGVRVPLTDEEWEDTFGDFGDVGEIGVHHPGSQQEIMQGHGHAIGNLMIQHSHRPFEGRHCFHGRSHGRNRMPRSAPLPPAIAPRLYTASQSRHRRKT